MKNNVPFDVAFALDDHELLAYGVIFGEFDGGKFNWDAMAWERE